jgi:dolichol-phosphate mannosyltransferase
MISIVIPTLNEAAAIQETLRRSAQALAATGEAFELIVVDDASSDGTADFCEALAHELPVRLLRRKGCSGLATAVVDGWRIARGDVLGVMDGDLQHPPEVLTALVEALRKSPADLVIGSRYVGNGGTSDWSWHRRVLSRVATRLAVLALPQRLIGVTDPMSGMFVVTAAALRGVVLAPTGYKILIEVLAKARCGRVIEVPYVFDRRNDGRSKLGARQYMQYVQHLAGLAWWSRHQAPVRHHFHGAPREDQKMPPESRGTGQTSQ